MYTFLKKTNQWEKKSFSQTGEDLIIKFLFDAIGIKNPSYIDIGAHHPYYLNNTALFYENGGKGINIEPDPSLFCLFPKYRKTDINLNCGISDNDGELMLNILNAPTLNTFSDEEANRMVNENNFKIINRTSIKVYAINTVLKKYCNDVFPDFMNVDVEGLDEKIIKSINYEKHKPTVICLETISYSETGHGIKNHDIIEFLKTKGYMVFADTYINTLFIVEDKWLRK
ncbi:MAG: FkbM family methyltransferase [Bacteroidia bacterium]